MLAAAPAFAQTAKPAAPAAKSAEADPIVISAGTEHIRASQLEALIAGAPAQTRAEMESNKRAVAEELGKMLALDAEARRQGLDQSPAFKAQMLVTRDSTLAKAEVERLQTTAKPTDAQIQAYYAAHASEFQQTKLRHILIGDNETPNGPNPRTKEAALAKATTIEARLKKGETFATVAKEVSDDPGSKEKGGELGDITPGQTVPEFETAVAKLPVGQVSEPIHTRFGYHIVEVESRATVPLEQAKSSIEQQLGTQSVNDAINKIAADAHVTLNDSYFGPAKPPAKPAGPGH
ncbi:MAG: peptidylprolyl isomerase [Terriglobales bacterium]